MPLKQLETPGWRSVPIAGPLVSYARPTCAFSQGNHGMRRTRWMSVFATVMALACASCSLTDSDPSDVASNSPSTSLSTSTPSPSTSPSVAAYLKNYTPAERRAYAAAVRANHRFIKKNDGLLRAGRLTKSAGAFYQRHATDWTVPWTALAQFVNSHVTVRGRARERWVRPARIDVRASAGPTVVLRRCLDERDIRVLQDGKPLAQPHLKVPHTYRVTMVKRRGETWWRAGMPERGARC